MTAGVYSFLASSHALLLFALQWVKVVDRVGSLMLEHYTQFVLKSLV